jgi:hypothetical protein
MTRKAFTVEEANALLPVARDVLEAIGKLRRELGLHRDKLQVLDALWGEAVGRAGNPDHEEYRTRRRSIQKAVSEIERLIQEEFIARGIRFPVGGLEHGLLDFPTTLDGRWVYLCWRHGEPEVAFWHEVDAGYPGRNPITPRERRRMGRPDDPARRDDSALDF